MEENIVNAPFSDEHIRKLEEHQNNVMYHPYTCDGEEDCNGNEERKLIPTKDGWICKCGKYTQDWSHKH